MSLRIIGGEFGGRILRSPKGDQTRPSSGLLRKAFFDICRNEIEGADFLDLFAGSGAMGLEALSRGANTAVFVDKSPIACRCIKENIGLLGLEERATVFCFTVDRAISHLSTKEKSYDLIYIDPPYNKHLLPSIFTQLGSSSLLKKGGRLFAEEADKEVESALKALQLPFELVATRKYGNSILLEYQILLPRL